MRDVKSTIATIKKTLRAFVTDDQGHVVIAQTPNVMKVVVYDGDITRVVDA